LRIRGGVHKTTLADPDGVPTPPPRVKSVAHRAAELSTGVWVVVAVGREGGRFKKRSHPPPPTQNGRGVGCGVSAAPRQAPG
jgi:hypothetical protein